MGLLLIKWSNKIMQLDNIGVGSIVELSKSGGDNQVAEVTGLGEKNMIPTIDHEDDNGNPRWAYYDQICNVIKY